MSKAEFIRFEIPGADMQPFPYKIMRAIPRGDDYYGALRPLIEDEGWCTLFDVVTGEAMSHALHGYTHPLAQELRWKPEDRLKRHAVKNLMCRYLTDQSCRRRKTAICRPCEKMPMCYAPEGDYQGLKLELLSSVKEGYYIVVVTSGEFALRT